MSEEILKPLHGSINKDGEIQKYNGSAEQQAIIKEILEFGEAAQDEDDFNEFFSAEAVERWKSGQA